MDNNTVSRYFLGANSPSGFFSLYDNFVNPDSGDFLWVLKGGPGCGKSGFMRTVAAAAHDAGLATELICCSGDPDSLDGVYIPALRLAYADGTAPHVLEPVYPAAASMYLDLGVFYDSGAAKDRLGEISRLTHRYKAMYARAYDVLSAAGSIAVYKYPGLVTDEDILAVRHRARRFAARELGKASAAAPSVPRRRFISAVTCLGPVFLSDTVTSLCKKVCLLDDRCGLAGYFISETAEAACRRGMEVILCPDPMCPHKPEALLLPEVSLALLAGNGRLNYTGEISRHFRLDAMLPAERVRTLRPELRRCSKLYSELTALATHELAAAKSLHDELEAVYNPLVDFDGVYALAREHIRAVL